MKRLAVVLMSLAGALTLSACSGSGASGPHGSDQGGNGPRSVAPPAAGAEPTATPNPLVDFSVLAPIMPTEPVSRDDSLLGGTPHRYAAEALTEAMLRPGLDSRAFDLHVLPMSNSDQAMLVIEIHSEASLAPEFQEAFKAALTGLVNDDWFTEARIGRIVLLTEMPEVFSATLTLPAATLLGMANGTLSQEQARQDVRFEVIAAEKP